MKKVIVLLALLCCMVCSAVPVFADAAPGGVGRDDVLNGDFSTAETEVKQGWEEVFSGLAGVLKFLADTIGGIFAILPASYSVYIVMLCLCIAVSAIIKVLTE